MWFVAAGFTTTSADDKGAKLMCMVNPTNPTGDYMDVDQVRHCTCGCLHCYQSR